MDIPPEKRKAIFVDENDENDEKEAKYPSMSDSEYDDNDDMELDDDEDMFEILEKQKKEKKQSEEKGDVYLTDKIIECGDPPIRYSLHEILPDKGYKFNAEQAVQYYDDLQLNDNGKLTKECKREPEAFWNRYSQIPQLFYVSKLAYYLLNIPASQAGMKSI